MTDQVYFCLFLDAFLICVKYGARKMARMSYLLQVLLLLAHLPVGSSLNFDDVHQSYRYPSEP